MQATPLQQSAGVVQFCPNTAQPGALASTPGFVGGIQGGGLMFPQTPWVDPMDWMQVEPGQQSPLMEQGPATGTQAGTTPPSTPPSGPPGVP